jgi:hypothetical protein
MLDANSRTLKGLDRVYDSLSKGGKGISREEFGNLPAGAAQRFAIEAKQVNLGAQAQLATLGGKRREIGAKEQLGALQEQQAIQNRILKDQQAQAQLDLETFNRQGITLEFLSEGGKNT